MNEDIIGIHDSIIKNFESDKNNIENLKQKLNQIKRTLNLSNITYRVKQRLEDDYELLSEKITNIANDSTLNFYLMETTPIIEEYKEILNKPIKINFMGKKETIHDNTQIIKEYLNIASKYKDISLQNDEKTFKIICNNCKNSKHFQIIDTEYICLDCGTILSFLTHHSSYKDVERVNMSAKYTYDRKVHFRDCINQFQGKQNSSIADTVYEELTEQFHLHRLLIGDKNIPKEKRFKNITKNSIYLFLKETGNSKHYEDINLIYYNLTGKQPDDISHLEAQLLEDFDILTDLYDKIFKKDKKIDRKNFINTQYVLFQLLRSHKYPCKKEDFNILKTIDRKSFHDDICKELFEKLGWNFVAIF